MATDAPAQNRRGPTAHDVAAGQIDLRSFRQRRTHAARADLMMRWYHLILENAGDLAQILTAEQAKPLSESRGEVAYGASFVRWFAEEARRINGKIIPSPVACKKIFAMKEPVGVCAIITPWNFPIAMITRKVAPGLAAAARWSSNRRISRPVRQLRWRFWPNVRAFRQAC